MNKELFESKMDALLVDMQTLVDALPPEASKGKLMTGIAAVEDAVAHLDFPADEHADLVKEFSGTDLERPYGLSNLGQLAWATIVTYLKKKELTYTGGCRAFFSSAEWASRGERYALRSELVVVYDGGDLSSVIPFEGHDTHKDLHNALDKLNVYIEDGTHWYAGVHQI
jgi:hypothetical protein